MRVRRVIESEPLHGRHKEVGFQALKTLHLHFGRILGLLALMAATLAAAQPPSAFQDKSTQPASQLSPADLSNIGIDQRLDQPVPLDLQFKDETGKTVKLGDYFHSGRPVLLNLVNAAREYATASDAFLISDYGYGAATPRLLNFIKSNHCLQNKPVTLDSRYRMLEFEGVTAATPNEPEVEEALGVKIGHDDKKLFAAGERLMKQMQLESLVITRGRDGMVAFEKDGAPLAVPIFGSDQVVDVTGAGDTVIATFTAALAAGADTADATRLANFAGGIVVMKRGTATVSNKELLAAIDQYSAITT